MVDFKHARKWMKEGRLICNPKFDGFYYQEDCKMMYSNKGVSASITSFLGWMLDDINWEIYKPEDGWSANWEINRQSHYVLTEVISIFEKLKQKVLKDLEKLDNHDRNRVWRTQVEDILKKRFGF